MVQIKLLPGAINEIVANVTDTQKITQADRYGLMAAILDESITEDERRSVDRLIRLLVKGRIQVTNEISMML